MQVRMSIREEVAQQELDDVALKDDADFEALLAKANVLSPVMHRPGCMPATWLTASAVISMILPC